MMLSTLTDAALYPPVPIPEELLALAPAYLPNRRKLRYDGDDMCVSLEHFAGRDQVLARSLYTKLTELLYRIADASADDEGRWREVTLWIERHNLDDVLGEVREFGVASCTERPSDELSKAIHDLRGGALNALLGRLQMLEYLPRDTRQLNTLFILARDHLKVMRSALTGLDDKRRNADRKPKCHDMRLMLEKWQETVVGPKWHERPMRMFIDCRYEGALTECCLESAAIDRIFYNITSNACRHATGERIDMTVFPMADPEGVSVRFVLSNQVGEVDAQYLRTLAGNAKSNADANLSLSTLFEPKVSSTGSGFGLTVVAEFVAHAFGLNDSAQALREQYIGAVLHGRTFYLWFHWPAASDNLPRKLDDYHQPKRSLSDD